MKRNCALTACIVLLAVYVSAQRLPQTVIPERYQVTLTPDFSKDNFAGDVAIQVKLTEPSTQIVLNSADITIQDASIKSGGSDQKAAVSFDKEKEQVTLTVPKPVSAGAAEIRIRYVGILNTEMRGFYLGKDDHGRKYGATQFEATDARRAFPCFDEPRYKAIFDISIVANKGLTAIANTEALSDKPGADGKHLVRFAPTKKISSYLVAFAVGNFEYVEGSADGVPIRVYTVPGKKALGQFALEASENFLQYFDKYFGIKYPYGKLDLIGLPDFSAGAMENVGLITFREVDLELDQQTASLSQKKSVAITISHEIAHEWFGDLVTMQWWDDVWLNEGFATWMESKPIEAWKPEWHVLLDEVGNGSILTTVGALNVDSLANTRPIHQAAETPGEIGELFDGIAYGKAAAVLRMVEAYLGPETFRKGVNAYLNQYAYGNATAEDFSNALAHASGKPVDKVMDSFVQQPGTPLISVATKCAGNQTEVSLKQQRFFYDPEKFSAGSDQLWQVPVCLKGDRHDGENDCHLLTKRTETFTIAGCPAWVIANGGGTGYYRSGYSSAAVHAVAGDAETNLTALERILLLTDVWSSVRLGQQPIGDYLTLAGGLNTEHSSAVFNTMLNQLEYVGHYLVSENDKTRYQAWLQATLKPLAAQIGWDSSPNDTDDIKTMRADLLNILGTTAADPAAIAEGQKLARQVLKDPNSVNRDLATAALAVAGEHGDATFYDEVLAEMKNSKSPEDYYRYFYTLPEFSDPQLVQRTLQFAVSPEVRSQDALGLIVREMARPAAQKTAWDFVRTNWSKVEKAGGPFASAYLQHGAGYFCDATMRDEAQTFFAAHPSDAAKRTLKQSMEGIHNCIALKSAQAPRLASWLESRGGTARDAQTVRSEP